MDATMIVREALQALQDWDLERHMLYIGDDVVVELANDGDVILHGTTAYREHMEQFNQFPEGLGISGFQINSSSSSDDLSRISAEVYVPLNIPLSDGKVNDEPQIADFVFAVRGDLIRHMRVAARNIPKVWVYKGDR